MSELDNLYCLETDHFFDSSGENTRKITMGILPTVFSQKSHYWGLLLPLSEDWKFSRKKTTQMQPTLYLDFFVTYREIFNMSTENENSIVVDEVLSFSQQSTSSPVVFDSVKKSTITFLY